jgi:hypothetical protein
MPNKEHKHLVMHSNQAWNINTWSCVEIKKRTKTFDNAFELSKKIKTHINAPTLKK